MGAIRCIKAVLELYRIVISCGSVSHKEGSPLTQPRSFFFLITTYVSECGLRIRGVGGVVVTCKCTMKTDLSGLILGSHLSFNVDMLLDAWGSYSVSIV